VNVFLAWSGEASKAVAVALREWLPFVRQSVQPFMSEEDIRKGARWRQEIAKQLSSTGFAILCLTPDNLNSTWLHFEAGAIATRAESNHVTALLLGVEKKDVVDPLGEFQHTRATKDDMLKLVKGLNALQGQQAIPETRLVATFDRFWDDLDAKLMEAAKKTDQKKAVVKRNPEELLPEILENSRTQARAQTALLESQQRLISTLDRLTSAYSGAIPTFSGVGSGGLFGGLGLSDVPPRAGLLGDVASSKGGTTIPDLLAREILKSLQKETADKHRIGTIELPGKPDQPPPNDDPKNLG
jgi:hypothetical protein